MQPEEKDKEQAILRTQKSWQKLLKAVFDDTSVAQAWMRAQGRDATGTKIHTEILAMLRDSEKESKWEAKSKVEPEAAQARSIWRFWEKDEDEFEESLVMTAIIQQGKRTYPHAVEAVRESHSTGRAQIEAAGENGQIQRRRLRSSLRGKEQEGTFKMVWRKKAAERSLYRGRATCRV